MSYPSAPISRMPPQLGDSAQFIVIGANIFSSKSRRFPYLGSDIIAISKPPAGTICPSTLPGGMAQNITIGGAQFFGPVPANEIDDRSTARIVATQPSSVFPRTELGLFSVVADSSGNPVFPAGSILTVNQYNIPPNAPQRGTSFLLQTLDGQITQAVGAIDPLRGKFAVWAVHTIEGGAGSEIRWYEIQPADNTLLQFGSVKDPSLFLFNGAISPDRVVKGTSTAFGSNMLLNFNASSSQTFVSIEMVGKRGANPVSVPSVVLRSTGPDTDSTCPMLSGVCWWSLYAGASPDPNSPTSGPAGIVWSTSMWTKPGNSNGTPTWRSFNWKSQD